ncbi:MAG TPA: nuclease domain-containing protein, partial [Oscillospiraceae bacterium]|nr:nuclease domain-containing protein [Oscillospiraceae bacterium]
MAPGYRDVYKYYLMLKKGLVLYGDVFRLSIKDLAQLYEYWCFIKINSILRKKYNLIQDDLIKVHTNGVFVTLKKGATTRVRYQNPKNGEIFTVSYNLGMKSGTIPQKPDNVFSIIKDKSNLSYNYIFDAKYRINMAEEGSRYKERYSFPGPMESDINTMHRYRDAIIYQNNKAGGNESNAERNIFGAFVLFPYSNEEEYKEHELYKSIEFVNVGGIPFLPSSTKLVEEFLDELIEESAPSSYERSLRQRGHNYYLKSSYFDERTVLLGSLSNREQLDINLENKFYHTKLSNVDLEKHLIKTVAIGQSKKLFGDEAGVKYYGRVKDIKIVKRNEIKEIPRESDELYIRFEIDEWKQLDNPIKVEGFQVITVLYTTDYLLKNAKTVSELCIKHEEEFRLWMELKRLDSEVEAMSENKIDKKSSIKGFSIGIKDIYIIEDKIRIIEDGKVQDYLRSDFRRNPKLVVRLIRRV